MHKCQLKILFPIFNPTLCVLTISHFEEHQRTARIVTVLIVFTQEANGKINGCALFFVSDAPDHYRLSHLGMMADTHFPFSFAKRT